MDHIASTSVPKLAIQCSKLRQRVIQHQLEIFRYISYQSAQQAPPLMPNDAPLLPNDAPLQSFDLLPSAETNIAFDGGVQLTEWVLHG